MTTTAETIGRRPRARRGFRARQEARNGWLFMAPFSILFIIVFLVPIIVSVKSAFFSQVPSGEGLYGGGELVDTFVGFDNLVAAASNDAFWSGMGRVVLYAAFQIPVMIIVALALALLLDSFLVRRPAFFRLSFFLPFAIPGVIAAMIWMYMYTPEVSPFMQFLPEGTNFMAPGTILASMANMTTWTYTGYNMLIFLAALQSIPRELYEAARLDGANGFQISMKIKVPMVRGAALLAELLDGPGLHAHDAHLQLNDGRTVPLGQRPGIRILAADGRHRRRPRRRLCTPAA
ncbi:carbohydrate ABC transporter permease [Microbacterium sp.]|uniref:carbohydrate ABC transporter permease n=1 Tax=Microbacterium sp. TaxID=51671 RepID=UPI003F9466C5